MLVGAAWAVPAVSLTVATPAFATSNEPLTLSSATGRVPAAGASTLTATVRDTSGAPAAGRAVSFAGPANSSFSPASATTDGAGTAQTAFDLRNTWATPGSSVTVSALSDTQNASLALTVLGANAVAFGMNYTSTPAQAPLVFPSPIVAMAAGDEAPGRTPAVAFSVALLADGTVWTTGTNVYGELGDGSPTSRSTWAMVPGLAQVTQIAVGYGFVLALRGDGTVVAWGLNHRGQLGDGTTADQPLPRIVGGVPSTVVSIAASVGSGFAVLSDGDVMAWGSNVKGELGIGTISSTPSTPVRVLGLSAPVRRFSVGWRTPYAILTDGTLWAWGENQYGQVGDGTSTDRSLPTRVVGLAANVVQAAGGVSDGYALLTDGTVKHWTTWSGGSGRPTQVAGLASGVSSIHATANDLYAVFHDGSVKAWGENRSGERGDGTTGWDPQATQVLLPAGKAALPSQMNSPSGSAAYVVLPQSNEPLTLSSATGQVPAAGASTLTATVSDASGAAAAGRTVSFAGPANSSFSPASATTDAAGVAPTSFDLGAPWATPGSTVVVSAVSDAKNAPLALTVLGANAVAFGKHFTSTPTQVPLVFPSPIVAMASGDDPSGTNNEFFTVALLRDGTVWTTGANGYGQLGDGSTTARSTWAMVPGVDRIAQIAVHYGVVLARRSDGAVFGWGLNDQGQLGDGSTTNSPIPVAVAGLSSNVTSIATCGSANYALLSTGDIMAWGGNANGQLGIGSTTSSATPVKVQGLSSPARGLSTGLTTVYAVLSDGSLWAWGWNGYGQVGDGTSSDRSLPTPVTGLTSDVVQASGGVSNGYALLKDGSVRQWSLWNGGNGTPVGVPGLTSGVSRIHTISDTVFAVFSDGSVQAWGGNENGARGDGSTVWSSLPTQVLLPAGRTAVTSQLSSPSSSTMYIVTAS
ncbi:Alpha-tubulin suppressor [Microbacterium sp. ru370.1]|nr:Alpha-tubulin suppressor [Microbacterium sp. ru370.1]SIT93247.1 Alpha-tubulin suppressor [Microbacterium sp. RU1D]